MTENELGHLLRDAVPDPPRGLSPDTIVRSAKRRRMAQVAAAGGVTVALVAGLVVTLTNADTDGGSVVAATPPPPQPTSSVPPCAASDLRALASGGGVISNGVSGATITLTNIGRERCQLAERITSLRSVKVQAELPITPTVSDQGGPQDLAPGASAAFNIASTRVTGGSANCGRPAPQTLATPPILAFTLPGTGEINVDPPEGAVFTLGCWPVVVSRLYAAQPPSTASPAPSTTGPFRPSDVTFVSATHGWAISPGRLMQTADGGANWSKLTAPPEYADHIRFANSSVGYAWAVQKDLFITRDGGASWQPAKLTQVLSVEAAAGQVWALAGNQPYPDLWRGAVGGPSFTKIGGTPDRSGTLDVHDSVAYVVGLQGAGPIRGAIDVWDGTRLTQRQLPCNGKDLYVPDTPLGVSTDGSVFLVCVIEDSGNGITHRDLGFRSQDRGQSWQQVPAPSEPPRDVTATRASLFAWGKDLERYDGRTWRVVLTDAAGFSTVGFQDEQRGVALTGAGRLYLTRNGGTSWQAVAF